MTPAENSAVEDVYLSWQPGQGRQDLRAAGQHRPGLQHDHRHQGQHQGHPLQPGHDLPQRPVLLAGPRPQQPGRDDRLGRRDALKNFQRQWPDKPTLVYPPNAVSPPVGDDLYFQWTPVEHATRYQLDVSDDPNFSTFNTCFTPQTTYAVGYFDLPAYKCTPGQGAVTYWRVRALDEPANVQGIYSSIGTFVYSSDGRPARRPGARLHRRDPHPAVAGGAGRREVPRDARRTRRERRSSPTPTPSAGRRRQLRSTRRTARSAGPSSRSTPTARSRRSMRTGRFTLVPRSWDGLVAEPGGARLLARRDDTLPDADLDSGRECRLLPRRRRRARQRLLLRRHLRAAPHGQASVRRGDRHRQDPPRARASTTGRSRRSRAATSASVAGLWARSPSRTWPQWAAGDSPSTARGSTRPRAAPHTSTRRTSPGLRGRADDPAARLGSGAWGGLLHGLPRTGPGADQPRLPATDDSPDGLHPVEPDQRPHPERPPRQPGWSGVLLVRPALQGRRRVRP